MRPLPSPLLRALLPTAAALRTAAVKRHNSSGHDSTMKSATQDNRSVMDRLGAWDTRIDFPIVQESSIRHGTIVPRLGADSVGVCVSAGRRSYMEDRYTVVEPAPNLLLLAVWDGHGGAECSDFCTGSIGAHLTHRLEQHEQISEEPDLGIVLTEVVLDLNSSFEKHWRASGGSSPSPGSTATLALIRDGYELVVANVGDSRAILCREQRVLNLTVDHCPSVPEERARIESAGGTVVFDTIGRCMVNERLAMSRSLGDFELKRFGVTADPEVTRTSLKHGKDKYLLLTTDGVTFVMSDEEVISCVNQCEKPQEAAERLIDQALLYASEDNLTVLVLPLGSWGKGQAGSTSVMFNLGRNMALTSRYS